MLLRLKFVAQQITQEMTEKALKNKHLHSKMSKGITHSICALQKCLLDHQRHLVPIVTCPQGKRTQQQFLGRLSPPYSFSMVVTLKYVKGISGLLPFLKKSSVNSNISQFKGKTCSTVLYIVYNTCKRIMQQFIFITSSTSRKDNCYRCLLLAS